MVNYPNTTDRWTIEKDPALARRFQKIDVPEPSSEEAVQIVLGLKEGFEKHHHCTFTDDAIRTLRLAREAGGWDLVKLEVLGEARTLYPDMRETLRATEHLAKEGFLPMVYCVDDPIAAKRLEDAGAVAIMPLGAPMVSSEGACAAWYRYRR